VAVVVGLALELVDEVGLVDVDDVGLVDVDDDDAGLLVLELLGPEPPEPGEGPAMLVVIGPFST
jgi:hypothetical protein